MDAVLDAMVLMPTEPVVHVQNVIIERGNGFGGEFVGLQNIQPKIHLILHRNFGHEESTMDLFRVGTKNVERLSFRF